MEKNNRNRIIAALSVLVILITGGISAKEYIKYRNKVKLDAKIETKMKEYLEQLKSQYVYNTNTNRYEHVIKVSAEPLFDTPEGYRLENGMNVGYKTNEDGDLIKDIQTAPIYSPNGYVYNASTRLCESNIIIEVMPEGWTPDELDKSNNLEDQPVVKKIRAHD